MPPKKPASQEAGSPRPPPRHPQAPSTAGPLPLSTIYQDVRIEFVRGNILTFPAAAIVNAANVNLRGGGGLDGQFHHAAGPAMLAELTRTYPNGGRTGRVYATGSYDIQSARLVFHAVGPDYRTADTVEKQERAERLLRHLYDEVLSLALERGARSVALPTISTGIFGFPRDRAAEIALEAVTTFLDILATSEGGAFEHFDCISFLLWPPGTEDEITYRNLFPIFFGRRARHPDLGETSESENSEAQDAHSSDEDQDKNYDVNSPVHIKNEHASGDVQPPPDFFKGEDDSGDGLPSPKHVKDENNSQQDEDDSKSRSDSQDGSDSQGGNSPHRAGSQSPPGSPNSPSQEPNSSSSFSSNDSSDNDLFILGSNAGVPLSPASASQLSASPTPSSHSTDVEDDDDDNAPATCAGITKKGERCKRAPNKGELYCHSHMDQA